MRFIKQFIVILAVSFAGEVLRYFIPLPVPAGIYGLVIMFVCLHFRLIKSEQVSETASFLIEIMPLMFIPAAVGLISYWNLIKVNLVAYIIITVVSTVTVMAVCGRVTQFVIRRIKKKGEVKSSNV